MGFNPLKMVRKALRSNSLLVKVAAAFLVFWLFGMVTSAVGLEGFQAGVKGDMMVYFHMNGCPHCTKFNPEWEKFASSTKMKTKKGSDERTRQSSDHSKRGNSISIKRSFRVQSPSLRQRKHNDPKKDKSECLDLSKVF